MTNQTFRSKSKEHVIQLECIAWFRNEFERKNLGCIIPVVNEATYNNKSQIIKEGCSDLIIVFKNVVLFCELKTAIGKQRDAQISFEKLICELEYKYKICRSLGEFKTFIYENIHT